jgi:hypothetical protein
MALRWHCSKQGTRWVHKIGARNTPQHITCRQKRLAMKSPKAAWKHSMWHGTQEYIKPQRNMKMTRYTITNSWMFPSYHLSAAATASNTVVERICYFLCLERNQHEQ